MVLHTSPKIHLFIHNIYYATNIFVVKGVPSSKIFVFQGASRFVKG